MGYLFVSSDQGVGNANAFTVHLPRQIDGRALKLINVTIDNTLVANRQIGIHIDELNPATVASVSPAQFIVTLTQVVGTEVIFNENTYTQTIPFVAPLRSLTVKLYTIAGVPITTQSNPWSMLFEVC